MAKQFKKLVSDKKLKMLYAFEYYAYENIIDYTISK